MGYIQNQDIFIRVLSICTYLLCSSDTVCGDMGAVTKEVVDPSTEKITYRIQHFHQRLQKAVSCSNCNFAEP